MNNNFLKNITFALIAVLVLFLSACASSKAAIPDSLTPAEFVQRAQEATDRNRYKIALNYYEALLIRFPKNTEMVCTAEYGIAHTKYKQKKYTEARERLEALLARYDTPDHELLPKHFQRLAEIVLDNIDRKEQRMRFSRKKPEAQSNN